MLFFALFCLINPQAPNEIAASAIHKSQANRQSFDQFVCKFEVTVGDVVDLESARRLTVGKVRGNGSGVWAKDHEDELYVLRPGDVFEGESIVGRDGLAYMAVPFSGGEVIMRSNRHEMRLCEPVAAGSVELRQQGQFIAEFDPFEAFHLFGEGESSEPGMFALSHLQSGRNPSPRVTDQTDLLRIDLELVGGVGHVEFDKTRDFIVSKCEIIGDSYSSSWELIDSFNIPDLGTFPKLAIHVGGRNGALPKKCIIWKANSLELRAPREDELTFVANSKYQLHRGDPKKLIYLEDREVISPKRLESIYQEMATGKRVDVSQINGTRRFSVSVILVAVTACALYLWRRRLAN